MDDQSDYASAEMDNRPDSPHTDTASLATDDDSALTFLTPPPSIAPSPSKRAFQASTEQQLPVPPSELNETSLHFSPGGKTSAANHDVNKTGDRQKPLTLIDLPIDVLKLVVNEVTHTTDLCSVASTCSALHALAIPHIYGRFDIVWPDTTVGFDSRAGVDALTYGLSTLVMAEEGVCLRCGGKPTVPPVSQLRPGAPFRPARKRRRLNNYASFTKKFSLSNGPYDSIKDYNLRTESGKMLGTLCALAIAKMRNLEAFIWDMPTGIVRDVWLALSSLEEDRDADDPCRLEKVWVRFHDNRSAASDTVDHLPSATNTHPLNPPPLNPVNSPPSAPPPRDLYLSGIEDIESPNFSALPPVKSLSVMDIDELEYLDEISELIFRSRRRLKALRIGLVDSTTPANEWVESWKNVCYGPWSPAGGKRKDGVMGTLFCHLPETKYLATGQGHLKLTPEGYIADSDQLRLITTANSAGPSKLIPKTQVARFVEHLSPVEETPPQYPISAVPAEVYAMDESVRQDPLALEILALERVPITVIPLRDWIDWAKLRELTLLNCDNTDQLWRMLRKKFTPDGGSSASVYRTEGLPSTASHSKGLAHGLKPMHMDYTLKLTSIHVNRVSTSFLHFVKDALAPNSLEVLFLQDVDSRASRDQIFNAVVKRHRHSLMRFSMDSIPRPMTGDESNVRVRSYANKWSLNREMLQFIVSGSMPALREACFSIEYSDWHFFVQRLHLIPHLRSLYIPSLMDPHDRDLDPKELIHQMVDAIELRSEIELCYVGLLDKCFEILEGSACDRDTSSGAVGVHDDINDNDDDEDQNDADHDADDEDDDGTISADGSLDDDSDVFSDASGATHGDLSGGHGKPQVKAREILFYDDRVPIFKIRHGRL